MSFIPNSSSPFDIPMDEPSFCSLAEGSSHRKRQFMRKPAISPSLLLADRRKKQGERERSTQQAVLDSIKSWRQDKKQSCNKNNSLTATISHETSLNQKSQSKGDISQKQLLLGMKYIQKPSCSNGAFFHQESSTIRKQRKKDLDETVDASNSSQPQSSRAIHTVKLSEGSQSNNQSYRSQPSRARLRGDGQQKWCQNCKFFQQKYQILQERSSQLQQQLEIKAKMIQDMSKRQEKLRGEKEKIEKQMGSVIEELETRMRQNQRDLACTFSAAKEEITKLNERLKYTQMQNGMLLRFKEEFVAVVKDSDRLRSDNQYLKKQISAIAKMERLEFQKVKGKLGGTHVVDKDKMGKGSRRGKEEDIISLDLSEWSTEQL